MPSKFQRMWEESERKLRIYERVHDRAADVTIMRAALTVLNRHDLAREFGPGESGFSHCDQHTVKPDPWKDVPAHYKRERWSVDHRDKDGMFFVHSGGHSLCQAEDSEVCFAIAAAFNAAHF